MEESTYTTWRSQCQNWSEVKEANKYTRIPPNIFNFRSHSGGLKRYILEEVTRPVVETPPEDLYFIENGTVADLGFVYFDSGEKFAPSLIDHLDVMDIEQLIKYGNGDIPYLDGEAVFIFKAGKNNYGHLLVEMLPKLENVVLLSDERVHFVLPALPPSLAREIVSIVNLAYPQKFDFYQMRHPLLRVKRLIYPGPVSKHNRRKSRTLLSFVEKMKDLFPHRGVTPEKIYVSREKSSKRKMKNEPSIRAYFESIGYVSLFPEDMTIEEQVVFFSAAKEVAGPLGAGMSNCVFAPHGAQVVMLDPGLYDFFFYDLCSLVGQEFNWVFSGEIVEKGIHSLTEDFLFPENVIRTIFT